MRRRWTAKTRREPLSAGLRRYLETGDYHDAHGVVDKEMFFLERRHLPARWEQHGPAITEDRVAQHPGTRRWAWWMFDATEPRRCLEGLAVLALGYPRASGKRGSGGLSSSRCGCRATPTS